MTTTYDLAALDAAHAKVEGGRAGLDDLRVYVDMLHNAWPAVSAEVKRLRLLEACAQEAVRSEPTGEWVEEMTKILEEVPNA